MKKILFLIIGLFIATTLYAEQWKSSNPHGIRGVYDKDHYARWLGVPHYGQPTKYTCGSSVTSMQLGWETHKKGKHLKFNILGVHNYINTTGGRESGLTAPELKDGQTNLRRYLNSRYKFDFNIHEMIELKESKIGYATYTILTQMFDNYSTAIIYGNTDTLVSGAGGHYYLVTGAYNGNGKAGLYINDSVYNSSAYPKGSALAKQAISPRQFLSSKELEKYWKPTGSRLSWLRKHIFLVNREDRP